MLDWDRSHDYVLLRSQYKLTRITIRFRTLPPSVAELIALRKCLPSFRDMPPGKVREMVGHSHELMVDSLPIEAANRLIEAIRAEGLEVLTKNESFNRYLPFDRTTGCAWCIENRDEAAAVAQAMIAEGVPVLDSTVT